MDHVRGSTRDLRLLSELVLCPPETSNREHSSVRREQLNETAAGLSVHDLEQLEALASANHVIIRGLVPLQNLLAANGNVEGAEWVANAVQREEKRIDHALNFLDQICSTLARNECPVTVIKSLDHWPDLGNDLDLYTDASASSVVDVMRSAFQAKVDVRSWGDRLANKWNFIVPGLPELVEVHVGRLGQTGEQIAVTRSLAKRSTYTRIDSHVFRVTAPEDRIIISTLQRMYRHFYIRLCDIVDNAQLLDAHRVDFACLRSLGLSGGLWDGIATYLSIISEYVEAYRGYGVPLPSFATRAAKFGSDQVRFRRDFLRVSILPHSLKLYASELKNFVQKGDIRNGLRLSLLPCLATAAALGQKITGSDKGVW